MCVCVTDAVDMFQFGSVWGHSEENERASRAGARSQSQVSGRADHHKPLHIPSRGKLTHSHTREGKRILLLGNSSLVPRLSLLRAFNYYV